MKYYLILDISFVIVALFRVLRPALFLASEDVEVNKPIHYTVFSVIAFIFFPVLFPIIFFNSEKFILGYAESIIND